MKKIFIDTSVFVRFFTRDNEDKFDDCVRLFKLVEMGKIRPYISNIVVTELLFVLNRIYKFPKSQVVADLQKILTLRNITLIERTNTKRALALFRKHSVKFGDCLIATQIPKGATLITYDADFSRILPHPPMTPFQVNAQTN